MKTPPTPTPAARRAARAVAKYGFFSKPPDKWEADLTRLIDAETRLPEKEAMLEHCEQLLRAEGYKFYADQIKALLSPAAKPE